jgi:hypothetical protein
MIPDRSNRPAASGLALALVVLGGLAGFAGAVPGASFGSPSAPRADQATALPQPPASQATAEAAAAKAPCQVVAGPYTLAVVGSTAAVSAELQNVGQAPATLDAIEAGWSGAAVLTTIAFDNGTVVQAKSATSPALIPLAGAAPVVIAPGATISMRLTFTRPDPVAPWAPGPIAVLVREGCVVALRSAPEAGESVTACPLSVTRPAADAEVPERVSVRLSNQGTAPIDLAMLELAWPSDTNGALVVLQLGDASKVAIEPALVRSPGALDFRRWFGDAATVAAGTEITLTLTFERPAAATGYAISVSTRQGCIASATDWLANPYCGLGISSFEPRGHAAHAKVVNRAGISQTLAVLDVFWTPAINGPLAQVLVDGKPVWQAGSAISPTSIRSFDRAVVIGPDSTAEIQLRFDPTVGMPAVDPSRAILDVAGGSSDAPGPVAGSELGGDITILAGFVGGCQAGFSTLSGGAGGCRVFAADQLIPRKDALRHEVAANVINTGSTAILRSLTLTWPQRNGYLTGVYLDSTPLLLRPVSPSSQPYALDLGSLETLLLPRGSTQPLRLTFALPPAGGGYSAVLGLSDVTGEPCGEVVVTAPPIIPDCDKLGFADKMEIKGRNVLLTLRNDSPDPVKISDIRLGWPELPGMTLFRLASVALIDADRGEWNIWSGPSPAQPPITVRPEATAGPAVIEPGTSVILRLAFDPAPPDEAPDDAKFRDGLKLSVGFVEGCRVAYPLDGARIASRSVEFAGVIRDFPKKDGVETRFGCCWQIFADREAQMRLVEVDADTQLRPETVQPKRGDIVQVEALVSPDEKLYARRIIFRTQRPEEVIVGAIEQMEPEEVVPPAVPDQIKVNDTIVKISDRTDIPDVTTFRTGARVAVRGTRNDRDEMDALRVELLDPRTNQSVAIRGAVREVLDATEPGMQSLWLVDHYLVQVPNGVVIQGLPPSGRPGLGWEARIEGTQQGEVITAAGGQLLPAPQLHEIDGTLVSLPSGGLRGDWQIKTQAGETVFTVETSAVVNTRAAPVAPGLHVHVVVRDNGVDTPVAVSVRMDWP